MNANVVNFEHAMAPTTGAPLRQYTGTGAVIAPHALAATTRYVFWSLETAAGRIRWDGTAATATVGHALANGNSGTLGRKQWEAASIYLAAGAVLTVSEMQR